MVNIANAIGRICITNEVVSNLAGDAATSCVGVKGMVGRSQGSGPFQLLTTMAASHWICTSGWTRA